MNDIALKVENVSKQYRLGTVGTGTLSQDLNRWFAKVRGKEDPFLKVGETNDRTSTGNSDFVWALRDLNFEIKKGDVVGIIGRNGAGKSTLLKLLSKTTLPTTGKIKINGRIASLLEVGTGFHPELTGRDNIFLNGAILGMTKKEIQSKFDEIVEFAGVARYVDTPVKRYSSGMYVRLAFAVAAHLDPDILIVDEVLAVGDAEFQKKAIGKMKSVSEEGGRTVLFVSHNMAAVSSFCTTGIFMKNGRIDDQGSIKPLIAKYLNETEKFDNNSLWQGIIEDENVIIKEAKVYSLDTENGFHTSADLIVELSGEIKKPVYGLILGFNLWSQFGYEIAYSLFDDSSDNIETQQIGTFTKKFKIPADTLAEGNYRIQFDVGIHNVKRIVNDECNLSFVLNNIVGIGRNYLVGSQQGKSSLIRAKWSI